MSEQLTREELASKWRSRVQHHRERRRFALCVLYAGLAITAFLAASITLLLRDPEAWLYLSFLAFAAGQCFVAYLYSDLLASVLRCPNCELDPRPSSLSWQKAVPEELVRCDKCLALLGLQDPALSVTPHSCGRVEHDNDA